MHARSVIVVRQGPVSFTSRLLLAERQYITRLSVCSAGLSAGILVPAPRLSSIELFDVSYRRNHGRRVIAAKAGSAVGRQTLHDP